MGKVVDTLDVAQEIAQRTGRWVVYILTHDPNAKEAVIRLPHPCAPGLDFGRQGETLDVFGFGKGGEGRNEVLEAIIDACDIFNERARGLKVAVVNISNASVTVH